MIELTDIRRYAIALPEVVEQTHFQLPGFRVADKLLAHLEKGAAHATVCIGQEKAEAAAGTRPPLTPMTGQSMFPYASWLH